MGRISKELRIEIYETQAIILEELRKNKETYSHPNNEVFESILKIEDVKSSIGEAGVVVKNYASQVLLNHPDVAALTTAKEWDLFSYTFFRALDGSEENKKALNEYKFLLKQMMSPKPRLTKDPIKRNELRNSKKSIRHIGLKQVYMLGENGFYSHTDNFKMHVRGSTRHEDEIKLLQKQQSIFTSKNMPEVSHTVKRRVKEIEEMKNSSYYGFHRMKPTDAAIISARMLGLKWNEMDFITIPFDFFSTRLWIVPDKKEEPKDDLKRLMVMKDRKSIISDIYSFSYQPRLYPFDKFGPIPNLVLKLISITESLQELNGCPAFDYYWVVVPSININHPYFRHKDEWKIYNPIGKIQTFNEEYVAASALDTILVSEGYVTPVVLGEKDGKCYFICLWD